MNQQQSDRQGTRTVNNRGGLEILLFMAAAAIGIYSLGRGLTGMVEPGQGISLSWLAVTGVAVVVLFAQMGRVHDSWPRQLEEQGQPQAEEQRAQLP